MKRLPQKNQNKNHTLHRGAHQQILGARQEEVINTWMVFSQHLRIAPSTPVTPMPSTMSRVSRNGMSSGVCSNLPWYPTYPHAPTTTLRVNVALLACTISLLTTTIYSIRQTQQADQISGTSMNINMEILWQKITHRTRAQCKITRVVSLTACSKHNVNIFSELSKQHYNHSMRQSYRITETKHTQTRLSIQLYNQILTITETLVSS